MSFYQVNLAVFAAGNAYLLYRQYRREHGKTRETRPLASDPEGHEDDADTKDEERDLLGENGGGGGAQNREAVRSFQRDFFTVYALAVAADWLQVRSHASYILLLENLTPFASVSMTTNITLLTFLVGPPHIRHLQVRKGHSREDRRGAVRRRVHLRCRLGVLRWPAGGPAREAAGVSGLLRQLRGDVPVDAQRRPGGATCGPASGRGVDDPTIQRVRGVDDLRVPPPRAVWLGAPAGHGVRVHDHAELRSGHRVGRRGRRAGGGDGRSGVAFLGEHCVQRFCGVPNLEDLGE